jgi:PadR family transcriptional regulator, regulatory protein PadR
MRKLDPEYLIPLSPINYQIMVALAGRPLYAFALIEECEHDSEHVMDIPAGTMYPALKTLEKLRYIRCVREETGAGSPHPRRIFALTPIGRLVLEQETARLRQTVHLAAHRLRRLDKIAP